MHDTVTMSWGRLSGGPRNPAAGTPRSAEFSPLPAREEQQLDTWEDDGGMVATPPKSVATLDVPVRLQMQLL